MSSCNDPRCHAEYDNVFPGYTEELSDVERAKNFLIRSGMGLRFQVCEKCGWKKDVNVGEVAYAIRYWNGLQEVITNVAHRLKVVHIEHKPTVDH